MVSPIIYRALNNCWPSRGRTLLVVEAAMECADILHALRVVAAWEYIGVISATLTIGLCCSGGDDGSLLTLLSEDAATPRSAREVTYLGKSESIHL